MAFRASFLGAALFATLLVLPAASLAQTDEQRAGARALAEQGGEAFDANRYSEAVDLFTRAESLVHATPHLLYIARSRAKLGQFVKARENYLRIINEPLAAGAPAVFREAQADAERELAEIEAKLGKLTIRVENAGAYKDLRVTLDGAPVAVVLLGTPQPIDPGTHRIEVSAQGVRPAVQTVNAVQAQAAVTTIKLDPPPASSRANSSSVVGTAPVDSGGGSTAKDSPSTGSGMRIAAYSAFGVGAVGLGVGTFFLLKKGSKQSDIDDICSLPGGSCPSNRADEVRSLDDDRVSAGKLSAVGFIAGGVAVGAGVTLFVLSRSKSAGTARGEPGITPWIGLQSAGVSGRF